MPKKKTDANTRAHLEWLGFVQPQGLVVSTPALNDAGAVLNRNDAEGQSLLRDCVDGTEPVIWDFEGFARSVLGWTFHKNFYVCVKDLEELPEDLVADLPDFGEMLKPDYAVRHRTRPTEDGPEWQLIIRTVDPSQGMDAAEAGPGTLDATAHGRLERLLRATGVEAGMLFNGRVIRLVSAPRGESSGWLDFRVRDMLETSGRPILAAMRLLLGEARLLRVPERARLTALLKESRQFQNVVSERLAEQVLHALYELVRGLQAAHDRSDGRLLRKVLERDPDEVYRGLLTVILRMVFLLYAEQRDLLPKGEVFARNYSLGGLFERLQENAAQHPTTMDFRYGAWAQLLVLFRMVHDGARARGIRLPARQGSLFDPERFQFLSRVPEDPERPAAGHVMVPLVPDGTVYRVLEKLLVLDGERISYRALDVEQIGSVYETMMGFRMETATGLSLAVKASKKNGAPSTVDLEALLTVGPGARRKWIQDRTDRKVTPKVNREVRKAQTIEDLHAALESALDKDATPDRVPRGAMVLQPGRERRASGSHYTPRSLTEPIVRKTLGPLLERLRASGPPTPEAVLDVKVCDPAMGSGAFLVEACRQLADELLDSWRTHGGGIEGASEEDELVVARRLVAQRCLYGVDRNPLAVDLAKMSLWLATLAKDHPLTFLDHSLRHGDSLLGLDRKGIERFHWVVDGNPVQLGLEAEEAIRRVDRVAELRGEIQGMDPTASRNEFLRLWTEAQRELTGARLLGDLVIDAFFTGSSKAKRERVRRVHALEVVNEDIASLENPLDPLRRADKPLASFHWEIEFPEVFERHRQGFDAIIGNPPFAGKNPLINGNHRGYLAWLKAVHPQSHGNADLAAHFFRRGFSLLRDGGNLGLIATNTIAQGDTRTTGLRWISKHGGVIYDATRRLPWPGQAAVVVSVVHIGKHGVVREILGDAVEPQPPYRLDRRKVDSISAFLVPGTVHDDPARLETNAGKSFQGSIVLGMGFTFDDTDRKGVASTLADRRRLLEENPANCDVIQPYMGGAELNRSPTQAHHRWVINFRDFPLGRDAGLKPGWVEVIQRTQTVSTSLNDVDGGEPVPLVSGCRDLLHLLRKYRDQAEVRLGEGSKASTDCRRLIKVVQQWLVLGTVPLDYPHPVAADWPELLEIVRDKVEPSRKKVKNKDLRERWWQFARIRPALYGAIRGLHRVLAISRVTEHMAFSFLPTRMVYSDRLVLFPISSFDVFCVLQSRLHETWARHFGSSLRDDLAYTPSDCFETFPFPADWRSHPELETAGRDYYEFRAQLMQRNGEGLTKTYNRFHDYYENDPDFERFRKLHNRVDRAVLDAYGWTGIAPACDFRDDSRYQGKKSHSRYGWSDEVQEEVLGKLLDLNATVSQQQM
ncbi:MAG: N-6 DNA methylase [Bryobacterales bacterium]|nr:N-6 DNA methylase [Bryobacterales bacterium]